MPSPQSLLGFCLVALGMVLTPGPNMIYLISRSICQGRNAGLISLGGVALGNSDSMLDSGHAFGAWHVAHHDVQGISYRPRTALRTTLPLARPSRIHAAMP